MDDLHSDDREVSYIRRISRRRSSDPSPFGEESSGAPYPKGSSKESKLDESLTTLERAGLNRNYLDPPKSTMGFGVRSRIERRRANPPKMLNYLSLMPPRLKDFPFLKMLLSDS